MVKLLPTLAGKIGFGVLKKSCPAQGAHQLRQDMSFVETGQMSAVETGQMSAAETGQMSAVETRQMYRIKTGQSPVAIVDICLVSTAVTPI